MSMFPEGDTAKPFDDEDRSAKKLNEILYAIHGNVGFTPFPEGVQPLPGDDLRRSLVKIDAIQNTL